MNATLKQTESHYAKVELNWFVNQSLKTPTSAALEMAVDAIYADYQLEARLLESKSIPTLDFVSERFATVAKKWLQVNSPHTQLQVMGGILGASRSI